MHLTLTGAQLTVTRLPHDPPMRGGTWGTAESAFWRALQTRLNRERWQDRVWLKCVPSKHGHMTGAPYYLTTAERDTAVHHDRYALEDPSTVYNAGDPVRLCYFPAAPAAPAGPAGGG